jgi:hypothetical protein
MTRPRHRRAGETDPEGSPRRTRWLIGAVIHTGRRGTRSDGRSRRDDSGFRPSPCLALDRQLPLARVRVPGSRPGADLRRSRHAQSTQARDLGTAQRDGRSVAEVHAAQRSRQSRVDLGRRCSWTNLHHQGRRDVSMLASAGACLSTVPNVPRLGGLTCWRALDATGVAPTCVWREIADDVRRRCIGGASGRTRHARPSGWARPSRSAAGREGRTCRPTTDGVRSSRSG